MSIQAIRKTGFLIEDGSLMGEAIGYLRGSGAFGKDLADRLDPIRAQTYYEPIQPKLIVDEIEEVA